MVLTQEWIFGAAAAEQNYLLTMQPTEAAWEEAVQKRCLSILNILPNNPCKPEYASVATRLETFRTADWHALAQTQEDLADAGFYYTGKRDHVMCFFCNGRLRNWSLGDDVWTEHARWYPDCVFVHNVKGHHFIDAAKRAQKISALTKSRAETQEKHSSTTKLRPNPVDEKDCKVIDAAYNADRQSTSAAPACKICMDRDIAMAFLPCGHLAACAQCVPALTDCPICRTEILSTLRIYWA